MMTSIPYSDGWKVKVDGKYVPTSKAWKSFLSFPITPGQHKVEFIFSQKGSLTGTVITILSVIALYFIRQKYKDQEESLV